jgi:predicted MFS family arabinose efflux permease
MKRPLSWLMLTLLVVAVSELQAMGMLPEMARSLSASTATIGTLISIYSFGMAIGGPLIVMALRLVPPKGALLGVVTAYAVLEACVPLVHDYW